VDGLRPRPDHGTPLIMQDRSYTLAQISVYPLKGAGGVELEAAEPDSFGIPGDRRWMLAHPGGLFISQRTHPRLALLRVRATGEDGGLGGRFRVEAPGIGAMVLPEGDASHRLMDVQVHKDRFRGRVLGGGGEWFSDYLGEACHLLFIPPEVHRPVDQEFAPGYRTSFADGYPLLVASESSLQDLNNHLALPAEMTRFRPNLVIGGSGPWEEDSWRVMEVGEARIDLVKPCARCSVTTVDQETGVTGKEPLSTMARVRRWEGKTFFGQNAVFSRNGSFRVGQSVRIVEEGEARPPLPPQRPPAR